MRAVAFPPRLTYIGGDIALSLIKQNRKNYAGPRRRFLQFDIVDHPFPEADVWFCRDCLFHLPHEFIFRALRNFCASNIKLVMMTNHINKDGFVNLDAKAGGFRLVDFFSPPFNLPRDVLFRIVDYIEPYPPREMCVWTREHIAGALAKMSTLHTENIARYGDDGGSTSRSDLENPERCEGAEAIPS
jgi:hypothetical protein